MSARVAIRCKIAPGMFSSERIIRFAIRAKEFSFFVAAESVKEGGAGDGLVWVDLLRGGATPIVVVPDEARTMIGVERTDLVEA